MGSRCIAVGPISSPSVIRKTDEPRSARGCFNFDNCVMKAEVGDAA